MGFATEAAKFIGKGLAEGLLSSVADTTFGSFLSAIGLADETAQQQLEVSEQQLEKLNEISSKLDAVIGELRQIQDLVRITNDELRKLNEKADDHQTYNIWYDSHKEIEKIVINIDTNFTTYEDYITPTADGEFPAKSTIDAFAASIVEGSISNNIIGALGTIHGTVTGAGLGPGILAQYVDVLLIQLVPYKDIDVAGASSMEGRYSFKKEFLIERLTAYYGALLYAQLKAVSLIVEAYNYQGKLVEAKKVFDKYQRNLRSQENFFISAIWKIINAWLNGLVFWPGAYARVSDWDPDFKKIIPRDLFEMASLLNITTEDRPQEFIDGIANIQGFQTYMEEAETLLSSFMLVQPGLSWIIIHGTYYSGVFTGIGNDQGNDNFDDEAKAGQAVEKIKDVVAENTSLITQSDSVGATGPGDIKIESTYYDGLGRAKDRPIGLIRQRIEFTLPENARLAFEPNFGLNVNGLESYNHGNDSWDGPRKKFIDGISGEVASEEVAFFQFVPYVSNM